MEAEKVTKGETVGNRNCKGGRLVYSLFVIAIFVTNFGNKEKERRHARSYVLSANAELNKSPPLR